VASENLTVPKRTIELLEKLRGLGFSDDAFRILHHQSWATIDSMIRYCRKTETFRADDNNARVRERLQHVLSAVERQNLFAPIAPGTFAALTQEAVRQIPTDGSLRASGEIAWISGPDYEALFRELGFQDVSDRHKLQHRALGCTLYFNRSRTGLVYFTGYVRDAARFPGELWHQIAPQPEKDRDPSLITIVPIPGQERQAFERLLSLGSAENEVLDDEAEKRLHQRTDIGPTEIERLSKARRGQNVFRENVREIEKQCRITGVDDPLMLIASHIKPWRVCSDVEKLDGYNGLLLAPHVDHLFDNGYISLEDDGEILVTATLDPQILRAWGMHVPVNVGRFHDRHKGYLAYHRLHVFQDRTRDVWPED
jgi:hypothetical protein